MALTRLKELREEAVMTVHELAEASGVSDDTISKIENGQRAARPSTLRKLASVLGVSPQELRRPAKAMEPALPKGSAPEAGRFDNEAFEGWLEKHGARRILMSEEEVRERCEELASGNDREAIVANFFQEAADTYREKEGAKSALDRELMRGGELVPKVQGNMEEERARTARIREFRRELDRHYAGYIRDLELFQRDLYEAGKVNDFFFLAGSEEQAESKRRLLRVRQEEAFEDLRGA